MLKRSSALTQAMRVIASRHREHIHIHTFIEDADCPCGVTFDQAMRRDTEPFVLELNAEPSAVADLGDGRVG